MPSLTATMRWLSSHVKANVNREAAVDMEKGSSAILEDDTSGTANVIESIGSPQSVVKSRSEIMQASHQLVESSVFVGLTALLTVVILACEHMTAVDSPSEIVEAVLLCGLVVFAFELVVLCATKDGYMRSIWFPLDLLATMTLLMDLPWCQHMAFNDDCTFFSASQDHAARVGGQTIHAVRAVRTVRVLRVLRLVRLVKLCKLASRLFSCMKRRSARHHAMQVPCDITFFRKKRPSSKAADPDPWLPGSDWVEMTSR